MQQVFVANPKGGCGKTTISAQLCGYFACQGLRVLLVDHDALRCSSDWVKGRPASSPPINTVIAKLDESLNTDNTDWVVHDMPAAWSLENVENIIHPKDWVIIPVLSSPNDIKACIRFIMGLYRNGFFESEVHLGLVANRARINTRYFCILQQFLARMQLHVITTIRDTQNYVQVMDKGMTIFDFPEKKFRVDTAQWGPLLEWLTRHG